MKSIRSSRAKKTEVRASKMRQTKTGSSAKKTRTRRGGAGAGARMKRAAATGAGTSRAKGTKATAMKSRVSRSASVKAGSAKTKRSRGSTVKTSSRKPAAGAGSARQAKRVPSRRRQADTRDETVKRPRRQSPAVNLTGLGARPLQRRRVPSPPLSKTDGTREAETEISPPVDPVIAAIRTQARRHAARAPMMPRGPQAPKPMTPRSGKPLWRRPHSS